MSPKVPPTIEPDDGVHPERVTLAWQRTLLTLILIVAVTVRYGISLGAVPQFAWICGSAAIALVAATLMLNRNRYQTLRRRISQKEVATPPATQMFLISLAIILVGVLCFTISVSSFFD